MPLFVVEPALWDAAGPVRRAALVASLERLDSTTGRHLSIQYGDPRVVVPSVAAAAGATTVHVAADFGPYGRARDEAVAGALAGAGRELVRTGSPYAVTPGRVRKKDGTPYRVFTPFYRAWLEHGWRAPAPDPDPEPQWWEAVECQGRPTAPDLGFALPDLGEAAAHERWEAFLDGPIAQYAEHRNRPDQAGTSGLSADLKWGHLHPRTMLADLDESPEHAAFARQLAWREFYADVLATTPATARESLDPRFATMRYDEGPSATERLAAWQQGRTGYPFVDAGMRQLRGSGWMHNRVRMVVASFLVKDLHLPWWEGARWFMRWLADGDLASNAHGWQWTAGCGTDASPYYRVFNPVGQGLRFDPVGDYVRRWVPELAHLDGKAAHEPWTASDGLAHGYPARIVDHAAEREDALARYAELTRG
jgi:deoxyribodipyrimidine photo-lyase